MENSTPVLIGVGQYTEKDGSFAQSSSPMDIAGEASKRALIDTGIGNQLASQIDTLAVVRLFSDSSNRPRMQHTFGRAENPPRSIARRIGANPTNAIYGQLGGNTPQKLVNEMAQRIVEDDVKIALLTGAEAIKTQQSALRHGEQLDWQEEDSGGLEDRGLGEALTTKHEFDHGIGVPVQTYPLFENAIRGQRGDSIDDHLLSMGRLFEPFTKIASKNPFAFYGESRTATELANVSSKNRYIGFPYPKLMNARDAVNQGAAVLMTSVGTARALQVDPTKWVFLHGCGEANDKLVSERENYFSSPGIKISSSKALEMADKSIKEMACFDIYSCFPSAVEIACNELGLDYDDSRQLTVTGGLPFFGGPGNNYSMHAIAAMVERLRSTPNMYGMVTANGGWLSKHAVGIYSTTPFNGTWCRENPTIGQQIISSMKSPELSEKPEGNAVIETYTVYFDRNGPKRGIVIGRLVDNNKRFIANTPTDPSLLNSMIIEEGLDRKGTVSSANGMNIFIPL
jgi:acetyl-CoA C-acetyltransferase